MLSESAGETLRTWVQARSDEPTFWGEQPEQYLPDRHVLLHLGDVRRVGQDGVRYTFDGDLPDGQQMVPTVVGQREFTLRIEVRSFLQELGDTAEVTLVDLEAALQLPSFQQLCLTLNLGLIGTGPIVQADIVVDERVQSRAIMDIRFSTSIQVSDADEGQSYIATAEVQTTLQGGTTGNIVTSDTVGDVQ